MSSFLPGNDRIHSVDCEFVRAAVYPQSLIFVCSEPGNQINAAKQKTLTGNSLPGPVKSAATFRSREG